MAILLGVFGLHYYLFTNIGRRYQANSHCIVGTAQKRSSVEPEYMLVPYGEDQIL